MMNNVAEIAAIKAAATRSDIPLSNLILSQAHQARKIRAGKKTTIAQLAATIKTVGGLLQNLVVVQGADGMYEVCAGGRRLEALQLLHTAGDIPADFPVPCLIIPTDKAHHASLIENDAREDMHVADLIGAYGRLHADGWTPDAIATAHGVAVLAVKRMLALADLAPELMELLRDEKISLDVAQALVGVADHERQIAAYKASKHHYSPVFAIRQMLAETELPATAPVARYLTVQAYEKAGGSVRRDLFTQGNEGVFLADPALAQTLAIEKMQRSKLAKALHDEGWAWIECRADLSHDERRHYGEIGRVRREPNKKEAKQLADLQDQLDTKSRALSELQAQDEYLDSDEDALFEAVDKLENEIEELEQSFLVYDPEHMKVAGCILTLSHRGELISHQGLIRREDREAAAQLVAGSGAADADQDNPITLPAPVTRPAHSQALVERLAAQHAAAVAAEVARRPNLALCLMLTQMIGQLDRRGYTHSKHRFFNVSASSARYTLKSSDSTIEESPACQSLNEMQVRWDEFVANKSPDELLEALLGQPQDELLQLLALLLAQTVTSKDGNAGLQTSQLHHLAGIMDMDMANWWTPTRASYLDAVSKDQIVKVVTEAVDGASAAPLAKMKKGDAATHAEALLAGRRWLPEPLRAVERTTASAHD
ncbi:ParB/RepB/Spo0J family partition protein [Achromobacter xylosoxidans]|uniref:ParB/RepB/Spo0J family partition protein n=1 Tax=Achromobacter ruhlandii TaxID=72557 RepID=UPI003B9BCA4C